MSQTRIGETEHFWYRLQPEGIYVASQQGNRAFAHTHDRVMLSDDNGHTWPHSLAFPEADQITFSHILKSGNVIFGTGSRLYRSTDSLSTCEEVVVKGLDGRDYLPHVPKDPTRPGWYFHTLSGCCSWDVQGTEMLVWGNYCNVVGGATPVNIYYSVDGGRTVKLAYAFGQSPYTHDDGSPGGGTEGTALGNPDNPLCCRHIHTVAYNPAENAFYACTGDHDKPEGYEVHWLRGTYDAAADTWDWRVLVSDAMNSRYKAGGISFVDGQMYWISDSNCREPYDRGVFTCAPEDLTNLDAHTLLFDPGWESGAMIIEDGVFIASHCAPASPLSCGLIVSLDGGRTWAEHDLAELGSRSPTLLHPMNGEGWFRMDLRTGWIDYDQVLFLKPKLPGFSL